MDFIDCLESTSTLLTQGSVSDLLGRNPSADIDPELGYASLLYDDASAELLAGAHAGYIGAARRAGMPMLSMTTTWRADEARCGFGRFGTHDVNGDHVRFLRRVAASVPGTSPVFVAGVLGPRNDAYDPNQGLSRSEAARFHRFQAEALAAAGPDCLVGLTLPSVDEARGLASAMSGTDCPYLVSFVIGRDGCVLDGTPLHVAIDLIDQDQARPPLGYMVNCVHPSVLLGAAGSSARSCRDRIVGIRANGSTRSPRELDGSPEIVSTDPGQLAAQLAELRGVLDLKLLGGCCGTDLRHVEAMATQLRNHELNNGH